MSVRKYRNVPTEVDGITFHSKKEARRYADLKVLARIGEIKDLQLQPVYPLYVYLMTVSGNSGPIKIGEYRADFHYIGKDGIGVVEDVKSQATQDNRLYRWKKKHVEAQYGIRIQEV